MNSSDDFKLQMRLIKLTFFLVLYLHVTGCLWYFMAVVEHETLDEGTGTTIDHECTDNSFPDGMWIPNQWANYATFNHITSSFYC